jgi:hypothetical protein
VQLLQVAAQAPPHDVRSHLGLRISGFAPEKPSNGFFLTSDGDILIGSYTTRTAAEKMAAIAAQPGERW